MRSGDSRTLPRPLVIGGLAPDINRMAPTENRRMDTGEHAAAIARWDDEGGASMSVPYRSNAEVFKTERARRRAEPHSPEGDPAPPEDDRILECLGAAVIMRWGTLPTKIQRELFEDATSLADLGQTAELKGKVARFLHNRRDDGVSTITTMRRQVAI
jgi:hypothetical protein